MKYALLIGINYFGTSSELRGCINDVYNMKKFLTKLGYSCVTLTDNSDVKPTRDNIIKYMKEIVGKSKPGDSIFIHYSGHGSYIWDTSGDEVDGKDEVICPCDETYIVDDELNDILVKALPAGVSEICIFDCCHSGTAMDLPYRIVGDKVSTESALDIDKNIIMISGCADNQTSADAMIDKKFSGALTWAFLKCYKGQSWKDLLEKMRKILLRDGYDQIPQLSCSKKGFDCAKL